MCTLTWHRTPNGYDLFFNRDERRERKPAGPPVVRGCDRTPFIAPTDGDHGGTWIAVNAHGVSVCLLNGRAASDAADPPAEDEYRSRGLIPLSLIDATAAPLVAPRLDELDLGRFRPFVVVALDPQDGVVGRWDGRALTLRHGTPERQPLVSSSFCTAEVRAHRTAVFAEFVAGGEPVDPSELHLAFHRSHRPRAGAYSTCMHRPEAHTVSRSWIRVDPREIRFHYVPHPPCWTVVEPEPVRLARSRS